MSDRDAGVNRGQLKEAWESLERPHAKMGLLFNALEGAEDRESALRALTRLEDELELHFGLEEGPGGLYETLGPETRGATSVLADHGKLRRVVTETRSVFGEVFEFETRQIRAATLELGTLLRGHEKREHALVSQNLN